MKDFIAPIVASAWIIVSTFPAYADARDDVIANMARCNSLADPRLWLDCYYGAAQPMRSQLGLPPAPQSQLQLVPGGLQAVPSGSREVLVAPPPPSPPGPDGGFMGDLFGGAMLINRVPASSYSFDKSGIFTVALQNGQVWRQDTGDGNFAHWHGPANKIQVTIKKGFMGSPSLSVQIDHNVYKVHRIH